MPCSSVVFPAAILFSFSFIATRVARVAGGRCYAVCFFFFFRFGLPVAGGCVLLRHRFDHVTEIAKIDETRTQCLWLCLNDVTWGLFFGAKCSW